MDGQQGATGATSGEPTPDPTAPAAPAYQTPQDQPPTFQIRPSQPPMTAAPTASAPTAPQLAAPQPELGRPALARPPFLRTSLPPVPTPPSLSPEVATLLDGGLGDAPDTPIVVLPPIDQLDLGPRLSPKTGEPTRPPLLMASLALFYLASAVAAVTLAFTWWHAIHMATFDHAARIIQWLDPRPDAVRYAGTWQSVLAAVLMVITGVIMIAAPWLQAHNAFEGRRWTRVFGLVCVPISALAWLMTTGHPTFSHWAQWLTWFPWLGIPLCLVGAGLLWLPPLRRFFADFDYVRRPDLGTPPPTSGIQYGPLDRYR